MVCAFGSGDSVRLTVMLCDHVEVADGKLFVNGGGWDQIPPQGGPTGLAMLVHVPWDKTNERRTIQGALIDHDGKAVRQHGPGGENTIGFQLGFEVGRPVGVPPGSEVAVPFALNFPPMALQPHQGYTWLFTLDGDELGRVSFRTRAG